MRTLREEWTDFYSREKKLLAENYPGLTLARFLLEVQDILALRLHPQVELSQSNLTASKALTSTLGDEFKRGVPFSYLTQFSEFYGRRFFVDERVLVPRPETEYLVDLLVQERRVFDQALDVGTGSGVILLSLLGEGRVRQGTGVDLSPDALAVAGINAWRLRLDDKVQFLRSDRLEKVRGKFDLIVSNPPYIKAHAHRSLVHAKVEEHEPEEALFLPDEEYEQWFERFFDELSRALLPGGVFIMEGHEGELHRQAEQLVKTGLSGVQVLKDLSGRDRFLRGHLS